MKALRICVVMMVVVHSVSVFAGEHDVTSRGDPLPTGQNTENKLPIGPIFLGSFGAVTAVVGACFGWQSWEENDKYNTKGPEMNGQPVYPNATDDLADKIKAHSIAANALLFGGTAIVIGSVLWWLLDPAYKKNKEARATSKTANLKWYPSIAPGQAGLTVEF